MVAWVEHEHGSGSGARKGVARSYRADIDGLRAVAILSVVFYHAGLFRVTGGYVGVDIFFVISGFLIAGILREDLIAGRFSVIEFYERRARRILPALVTVVFACFAAAILLASPRDLVSFASSAVATALFVSNAWFSSVTSDYFASDAGLEPLLHTWSLAVEEQFYIIFPLLLRVLGCRWKHAVVWAVAAICVASFWAALRNVEAAPTSAFYLLPSRAWELGLGVLLAFGAGPAIDRIWLRETIAAAGLTAVAAAIFLYDSETPFPGLAALVPCVGAAMVIWAGSQGPTRVGRLLSARPVVFVGLISYSLYLWHWPLLVFPRRYLGAVDLPPAVAASAVAASFVLAVLSWRYIEAPFRRRPPDGLPRPLIFGASAGALALVIVFAGVALRTGGLAERFSPEVRMVFAATDEHTAFRMRCFSRRPEQGLCRIGAASGPHARIDFLLWGDSHALSAVPGVEAVGRKAGKTGLFVGESACAPLLDLDRADKPQSHGCAAFNDAVLAMLRSRDDLPLVILAGRWALVAEGHRPAGEAGAPAILVRAGSEAAAAVPSSNFALFRESLAKTVSAIRATGRRVVVVGSMPEIGWDVPDRLGNHLRWATEMPPAPTLGEVLERNARVDALLTELGEQEGVQVLPIAPRLCTPRCRVVDRGRPLYSDDDHLSRIGSVSVISPAFAESVWKVNPDSASEPRAAR